jgi:hypothetical protein
MANKVISTHTLSTTWRTSTTAYFLYQNGDSTYYKAELAGYISSLSSQFELKANITQSTWINVVFSSAWVDYGSTVYPPTSYRKDTTGDVHFRLAAKDGSATPICTLPAGYTPLYALIFPIYSIEASTSIGPVITITPAGLVNVSNFTSTYVMLGEVIFTPST